MVLSMNSARQMINAIRTGSKKDLGDLLDALLKGEPYQVGTGYPTVTPRAIGESYFDSTNKIFYTAVGLTSADWSLGGAAASSGLVLVGAALTVSAAHHNKTLLFDTAAGSIITLPVGSGSGLKFKAKVKLLATSNSHKVQVTGATDVIQGIINTIDSDTAGTTTGWASGASDDTVTLNRSTTGSAIRGEWLEFEDIAANLWVVNGQLANTAAGATPFSAAVS